MDGEKRSEWPEAIGACALICLLLGLALIASGGWKWFAAFLESSAPAWVQAVGSIGAIIATGWSVQRSHRLQQEQRSKDAEDEYTRLLDVAFHLVGRVKVIANKIQHFEDPPHFDKTSRRAMHAELVAWLDGFRRFDVHALRQYIYVECVLAGEAHARMLVAIMEADFQARRDFVAPTLQNQAANSVAQLQQHLLILEAALTAREVTAKEQRNLL